jgi:hypothetical protein
VTYLIGADPELFVVDGSGFVSGHHFACGTKAEPRKTPHGAVQVDGIALEFNVTPADTRDGFVSNLRNVMADLNSIVKATHPTAYLRAIPTADVGAKFLSEVPKENSELGCNPDYNAYSMSENPVPNALTPFRTGSGHVHVGFCDFDPSNLESFDHFMKAATVARQLDYFLGLPSLDWDSDGRRRALYGQAGAFRPKPYGMEYRVLSNKWVDDETLAGFVFDQTQKALAALDDGLDMANEFGIYAQEVLSAANTNWKTERPDVYRLVM